MDKETENHTSTKELEEYRAAREKRRAALSLLIAILFLFLLYAYALREGFFANLVSPTDDNAGVSLQVMTWVPPLVLGLMFFAGVLPKYLRWWKVSRQYSWSRQRRRQLETELHGTKTVSTTVTSTQQRMSVRSWFALVIAVVILIFVGYLFVTPSNTGPVAAISQWLSSILNPTVQYAKVSGAYERSYAGENTGSGAVITPQTWRYVYYDNGKFTTYMMGAQQFSGTWEQTGNKLTIHTPAIAGLSDKFDSFATVSPDAEFYEFEGNRWNRVH